MTKKLDELPYADENLRECIHPAKEVITYIYRPKTKKDKKAINDGQYPHDLNIFFHCLRNSRASGVPEMEQFTGDIPLECLWYKDKKDPFIMFKISRLVDLKYKNLFYFELENR